MRNVLSILYLRCGPIDVLALTQGELRRLSILYLRCDESLGEIERRFMRETFNSLFEMLQRARQYDAIIRRHDDFQFSI